MWKCSCGIINAGGAISEHRCAGIDYFTNEQHLQINASTFDSVLYWTRERTWNSLTNDENRFAQFFNAEMVLFSSMTEIEQIEHIQELEDIAFEAKARLTAAKTVQRDNEAKRKLKDKQWLVTATDVNVPSDSDLINKPKIRAQKMSKLDKMKDKLVALGLSDKEVESMLSKMIQQARKDKPDKPDTNGDASATAVTKPKPHSPFSPSAAELEPSTSQPLDLSKLKFT